MMYEITRVAGSPIIGVCLPDRIDDPSPCADLLPRFGQRPHWSIAPVLRMVYGRGPGRLSLIRKATPEECFASAGEVDRIHGHLPYAS